jgi:hypothetical protein
VSGKPEVHEEDTLEVTDAEEAVFEALLPIYLAGNLDIEKVRQVNRTVARLLEDVQQGIADGEAGRTYTRDEFNRIMAEAD